MKCYKIIFADLDGTLTDTISGETFPKGIWDMKIKFDVLDKIKEIKPLCLLIATNQEGIGKGLVNRRTFEFKMEYLRRSIKEYTGIEVEYSYCEKDDPECKYRKPNVGMIDSLVYKMIKRGIIENGILSDDILMVGDASDKKCAENAGFDYLDVEEFVKLL